MGLGHSPRIITDGMVLCLDAANPKNYNLTGVEVLVVAGGGAGGGYHGGGGGAGGLIYNSNFAVTPGTQLTVTVGAGGDAPTSSSNTGNPGGNSVFGALTAIGGGAGISQSNEAQARNNGGSGGGGCDGTGSVLHSGGSGTAGQGFKGGDVTGSGDQLAVYYGTAGGGGAGGAGGTGGILNGGFGGPGLGFNISGTSTYYAGGGGGTHLGSSSITNYGIGGIGGGGTGGISPSPHNSAFRSSTSGSPNTGGGGGGHLYNNLGGGAGGSGIVIVRYPGPQKAIGGTVTSVGGDTIHTFTTSGNFTPLVNTNGSAVLGLSDLSGNGNFGTSVNGPTYSSANGGSLTFDGSDDYVNCGSPSTLNFGTGNFNLSCWVNIPSTSGADWIGIISRYVSGVGFWIQLNPGNRYVGFGWDGSNYITSSFSAGGGQWKFISCQRTGSTSAEVYVNGISVASSSSMSSGTSNGQQIDIGRIDIAGRYSAGNIAQVSIYNRALSAAEVSQNYNALRSRFIQDGSSADRAAPSASHLSSIGIRVDGDYWYSPPGQTTPIQLYTVFSSAPADKGYVLVARGRESTDWWNTSGQNTSALTSTSINTNTPIAVLSNSFVNSLINSQWNGMRFITNRINGGDSWLFVGTTSTTFSWTYFQQSASTVNATATKYNSLFLSGGVALNYGTGVHWTDTLNYGNGNNCDRTFTWSWGGHGTYQGWSGGSGCNPAGAFQNGGEGHSIQLVNCYVEC